MIDLTIEIREGDLRRILNLQYVCSAAYIGDQLFVYMKDNGEPLVFCGSAADRLWRILQESSTLVFDLSAEAKNAEKLAEQLLDKNNSNNQTNQSMINRFSQGNQ